jgi:hypothetical protein
MKSRREEAQEANDMRVNFDQNLASSLLTCTIGYGPCLEFPQ